MYRKLKEVFDNKIIYAFKSKLGKRTVILIQSVLRMTKVFRTNGFLS